MSMTPDAKKHLAQTIRGLRETLLDSLHDATESAYRLSVRAQDSGLSAASRTQRARLEGWVAEQLRAEVQGQLRAQAKSTWSEDKRNQARQKIEDALVSAGRPEALRRDAQKQAAYTWINRLVFLRLLEASGLRTLPVLTGGYKSQGYMYYRELAPALVQDDATEGYAYLLQLIFEDLATDLPGLFGPAGVAELVPMPAGTLRALVEALDDEALASCWTDDMTLGWVYQYWNDPEREALDDKLNAGGKVQPHEIASKTQMFTERYMVDWLLQNSLGPLWLAMCKKQGWTPEAEATGLLADLEARRIAWRAQREAGEVELTALMPLHTEAEQRWANYVPQPIPEDAVQKAPASVRDLQILDPAVGSGHFLVVAFDLLFALYQEEARHRGEVGQDQWSHAAIAERILEKNLHGIDLDPRAVQIAAAALWLKARQVAGEIHPSTLNLVASNLKLSSLPEDDPALIELRTEVQRETGIPAKVTDTVVAALAGADHLGSLLQVDTAVQEAIAQHASELSKAKPEQGGLFSGFAEEAPRAPIDAETATKSLLDRLERFLAAHSSADDLGLRLRGQQLARGVRFSRMVQPGTYDLVVGNPPYQGTAKMADADYVKARYKRGKADLFAAFLERGLELVRPGGSSALLTMRNWMFIKQYSELRVGLLESYDLRALGDFDRGGFEEVPDEVVSVVVSVFRKTKPIAQASVALQPTPLDDRTRDSGRTQRKRAATRCQVGRFEFAAEALKVVPEWPVVYWWDDEFLTRFASAPRLEEVCNGIKNGLQTNDNSRYLRCPWEEGVDAEFPASAATCSNSSAWVPYVKGAAGLAWMHPLSHLVDWGRNGLSIKVLNEFVYGSPSRSVRNEERYFQSGVAITTKGVSFGARHFAAPSIFDVEGRSIFGADPAVALALLNGNFAGRVMASLNPTIHFTAGDAGRIPWLPDLYAQHVFDTLTTKFTTHEAHREPSVEFTHPGPSPWRHAQEWAQLAVDRPEGAPLPEYIEELDPEPATDHLSFALGVALGRFGTNQEGILDPQTADLSHALPHGLLFVDGSLPSGQVDAERNLGHPATQLLRDTWKARRHDIDAKLDLSEYLRTKFFSDVHRQMYENRPIHWPLSSAKKTFVAWVNIHRMNADTLRILLADHLQPALARLEGERTDLLAAKESPDKKAARDAERRFALVQKYREELSEFIADVEQCADRGPPPPDSKCPPREVDARYDPDLDDGVMINSAALWPLLTPQWKDPKKWCKELFTAKGRKDYDWAHLAMRYWPDRVDKKCQEDPSLGVAHGCFWAYHPARAWSWELRLQDEIGPDFRIEEAAYRGDGGDAAHRTAYLMDQPEAALEAIEKEVLRRRRKQKAPQAELHLLEAGLWTEHPEACWLLEETLSQKQEAEFRLRAPDETTARKAYLAAHPEAAAEREKRKAQHATPELFDTPPTPTLDSESEAHS